MSTSGATEPRALRRDAERNRQRILAAARELYARKGIAVSLDDVAHHAGVGVGTVYRRFPTKEALVEAALHDQLEAVVALAEEALAQPSAWEGQCLFLRKGAQMHAADQGLREVLLCSTQGDQHFAEARSRLEPMIGALVADAQAAGDLRPDVTEHDLPAIHLMVSAVAERARTFRPGLHERYLELLIDGLSARPVRGELGSPLTGAEAERFLG